MSLIHKHTAPLPSFKNFTLIFLLSTANQIRSIKKNQQLQTCLPNNSTIQNTIKATYVFQKVNSTQAKHWKEEVIQLLTMNSTLLNMLSVQPHETEEQWTMDTTFEVLFPSFPRLKQDTQSNVDRDHHLNVSTKSNMLLPVGQKKCYNLRTKVPSQVI